MTRFLARILTRLLTTMILDKNLVSIFLARIVEDSDMILVKNVVKNVVII